MGRGEEGVYCVLLEWYTVSHYSDSGGSDDEAKTAPTLTPEAAVHPSKVYMYRCDVQYMLQLTMYMYMHVREMKEGRKKEASKVKQTTRQSNTAHPRQLLFLRKMSCLC